MAEPEIKLIIAAYTEGLKKGFKQAGKETKGFTEKMADLNQALQLSTRLFADVGRMVKQVYALGIAGAQIERLEMQWLRVSGSEEEAAANLEVMRKATRGMVSDAKLMEQGLSLLVTGAAKNRDELETITRTVSALGKQMKNFAADRSMFSYMMVMSNGMQSLRMRADDFGVSVTIIEKRMNELVAAGMKQEEAFKQAFLEDLTRVYEELGLSAAGAADGALTFSAELQNLGDEIKKDFIPLTQRMAESLEWLAKPLKGLWQVFKTVFTSMLAVLNGVVSMFREYVTTVVTGAIAVGHALMGNFEKAKQAGELWLEHLKSFATGAAFVEGYTDIMDDFWTTAEEGAEDATDATDEYTQAIKDAATALEEAQQKLAEAMEEVNKEAQKKMADLTIRETWRAIDAQIAAQRKLEDEERQSAKRRIQIQAQYATAVAQALQQYQMAVIQAAKDRGERLAEIERDYQKRLRDIQRNYEVSAEDAIKSRDALALVTAQRQRDRELQEAKEARDEAANDAERQYQKQLEAAKEALRQQQEAAQEAMRQQMEELVQALEEKECEQELAEQRAAEDADRARARELGAIKTWQGQMLNSVDDTNRKELQKMIDHYDALVAERRKFYQRMAAAKSGGGSSKSTGVKSMQHGGSGIVTQPTLFLAGEAGPEKYKFTPLRGGQVASGGTGGTRASVQQNFSFSGSMSEDERQWFRQVARQQADAALSDALS